MTPASVILLGLARQASAAYTTHPRARAAMVSGSVADGLSDFYSDVDMMVYYQVLPSEEEFSQARAQNRGSERKWFVGNRAEGTVMEAYSVGGVEVQIVHYTLEAWEKQMAVVLEQHDVSTPLHKALSGMLKGIPLYGEPIIQGWKARIRDFPQALAEKMVNHYLNFFPVWGYQHQFAARDATLFYYQSLLEAAQNLLGVLAGLNRVYYSTFQFKRTKKFVEGLKIAPPNLAERIEGLFVSPLEVVAPGLEDLVQETAALVETQMPQVDTAKAKQPLGWRQEPWKPEVSVSL
ncbi:MAG TPA: hypothetical protein VFS50_13685 [Meiothermus sp.]|nr:hypothetical protein [Meiothermus sp.]